MEELILSALFVIATILAVCLWELRDINRFLRSKQDLDDRR